MIAGVQGLHRRVAPARRWICWPSTLRLAAARTANVTLNLIMTSIAKKHSAPGNQPSPPLPLPTCLRFKCIERVTHAGVSKVCCPRSRPLAVPCSHQRAHRLRAENINVVLVGHSFRRWSNKWSRCKFCRTCRYYRPAGGCFGLYKVGVTCTLGI